MKGADMKPKPYVHNRKEINYNNSQENWDYLKSCVEEHKTSSKEEFELAKERFKSAKNFEAKVSSMMLSDELDEHLFYKLHLMTMYDWDEETASRKATIICFQRNPPESFQGLYHRSLKIGDQTLNTKKASFLFEQVNDESLNYSEHIWITIYYLQDYTFFMLQYRYDVVEKRMAKDQRKVVIKVVETEKMMKRLKTNRLFKRFMKNHPAVYAAYLMEK
jgi:hypothetical protein